MVSHYSLAGGRVSPSELKASTGNSDLCCQPQRANVHSFFLWASANPKHGPIWGAASWANVNSCHVTAWARLGTWLRAALYGLHWELFSAANTFNSIERVNSVLKP